MKYRVNLTNKDLDQIIQKKILDLEITGKSKDSQTTEIHLSSLGKMKYRTIMTPGIITTDFESLFIKNTTLSGNSDLATLSMSFMLEGACNYQVPNLKSDVVKYGTNNIWSLPSGDVGIAQFLKNKKTKSFSVIFDKNYLESLVNRYPDLFSDTFEKHTKGVPFCMVEQHFITTNEINLIISQIKNSNIMGNIQNLYIESKVLELFALQLKQIQQYRSNTFIYCKTATDIDKIREAKNILLKNLNAPPSIQDLAKKIGMNDKKLKYGFKEIYKQTIYGCLFDYKMNLARQLLLDTQKTIFEIGIRCGYEYASHFSTAFKRKFGVSPNVFRKH